MPRGDAVAERAHLASPAALAGVPAALSRHPSRDKAASRRRWPNLDTVRTIADAIDPTQPRPRSKPTAASKRPHGARPPPFRGAWRPEPPPGAVSRGRDPGRAPGAAPRRAETTAQRSASRRRLSARDAARGPAGAVWGGEPRGGGDAPP